MLRSVPHFRTLTEISFELAHRLPPLYAEKPVFFLAQNEKEARLLLELARYWEPHFPEHCIISPYFIEQHSITKDQWNKRLIHLVAGLNLSIAQLSKQLTELGYERYPRAVADRCFAVRGDVVDIVDRLAIRLHYNDNQIERVELFNPNTQQSGKLLDYYDIWPLAYAPHLALWHEQNLEFEFVTPKYYNKRFGLLKKDAETYLRVQIATKQPDLVRSLLPDAVLTGWQRGLEGFIAPQQHCLFLTDDHIFGHEETEASFDESLDVTELQPGDYVVHIDHGIALFDKLTTLDGEEFLQLRYDKGDKLYVPVNKTNRVEKYVGSDHPKLTRLSGAQWDTVIHKVQEDIRRTARDLLELQVQRELASAHIIPDTASDTEQAVARDVDFELTADQTQAIADIYNDLAQDKPMDRLLCGDVGFGKTEVALRAAARVIEHGGQVAILAPTTVLAQQHFDTLSDRLTKYGITVGCLSRLTTTKAQHSLVKELGHGKVDLIIGTHRLLSKDIHIPKLALVVVDEEQRFGVKHKEQLKALRAAAHVLTMTATPIPRTLNLALSGLRGISVLNTAPQHRLGIKTIIDVFDPALELQAVADELERDGQVYIVHNNLSTIYSRQAFLRQRFPKATVAIAHGKMAATDLVRIMHDFHAGTINILVASTIIENGLDITNANTLVVEHAEQFGLAQLYQLRGRIGRGHTQAYAYLLYYAQHLTNQAKQRLKALHQIKELGGGFELAMKDLELRGVGDILGKKQHGHVQLIGLNLYLRLLQQAISQMQGE